MKFFNKILVAALASFAVVGCSDDCLETVPSTSGSGDDLMKNATSALTPLNGMYRMMYTSGWSTSGNTHQCFGISAYNLMADLMGEDMVMAAAGSGWFWYDCVYNVKSRYTSSSWRSYDVWSAYYKLISNANAVIAYENTMSGNASDVHYAIGQAYAIRAYSYFMLAQNFARTYEGHESDPCCPIYTTPTDKTTQGKPRSSVKEVYALITSDIAKAVSLLADTETKHVSHIGYDVALGLQARIALTTCDWATAAKAAEAAIANTGCKILDVNSFAGINNSSAANVMWAAQIIADQSGMYAGFFTHMDAENGPYASRAHKNINAELYAKLGENDQRRAWWDPSQKYLQEKFKFADPTNWLGDYIWMRVEEMYLSAAEAECRLGNEAKAKELLMKLMNLRDADYDCSKTGVALGKTTSVEDETGSLLEEILIQRRIELWGEYGRIYDIRRLRQGFRRTAAQGWPASALLAGRPTDDPESYMWVLTIPQAEFDGNASLDINKDQNPTGDFAE